MITKADQVDMVVVPEGTLEGMLKMDTGQVELVPGRGQDRAEHQEGTNVSILIVKMALECSSSTTYNSVSG